MPYRWLGTPEPKTQSEPYCRHELEALQAVYGDVRALGAEIVVLSPELPTFSAELAAKHKLTFPVLNDHGLTIAKAFGLVFTLPDDLKDVYLNVFKNDLAKRNGEPSWQLCRQAGCGKSAAYRGMGTDNFSQNNPAQSRVRLASTTLS